MLNYRQQDKWDNGNEGFQSPISLIYDDVINNQTDWQFDIKSPILGQLIEDSNNTFRITGTGNVTINQINFQFQELHFHAPSEHLIDKQQYPMEWHFVFKTNAMQTMVIGKMATEGKSSPVFDSILDEYVSGEQTKLSKHIDLTPFLQGLDHVYHYQGSLTTPPLTQGVEWYVDKDPFSLSELQIERYQDIFALPNNRKIQPMKHRPVSFGKM